ncbi:MAG: 50S ribosomal protein L23 [Enterobacteriaceae bacterium PSpyr]|nr:MAG: 50S ribosomal protein L23 [Enterobacteriaceae bacterium PSpyr]
MIGDKEKLINIIYKIHISEKVNNIIKKYNAVVLKVFKKANKTNIKKAIQQIFEIKVISIKTLLIKGKKFKINRNNYSYHKNWKKAYIFFEKKKKNSIIDI